MRYPTKEVPVRGSPKFLLAAAHMVLTREVADHKREQLMFQFQVVCSVTRMPAVFCVLTTCFGCKSNLTASGLGIPIASKTKAQSKCDRGAKTSRPVCVLRPPQFFGGTRRARWVILLLVLTENRIILMSCLSRGPAEKNCNGAIRRVREF